MQIDLQEDLFVAGWKIKKENPFSSNAPLIRHHQMPSPYVARIFSLWNEYREKVIPYFPLTSKGAINHKNYLAQLQDLYDKDAYNSLSIEGYVVNDSLIEKVKNTAWNPDTNPRDLEEKNALAARGYFEAFEEVKQSIEQIFQGINPGEIIEKDLKKWYQKLFSPMVRASLLRPEDLLGYRKTQVYIRYSRHIPLPNLAVPDAMEALFECIKKEEHPAIRAILGHYVFVYIHPYLDGNGRIGRFLMNALFVSGGYPWTIIQVKNRKEYLSSLEAVSSEKTIEPFAAFIASEMASS
jgi:Fic family protein